VLLEPGDVCLLTALGPEPRRHGVVGPSAEHEIPHVREIADRVEELLHVLTGRSAVAVQLVDCDPTGNGTPAVHLLECVLEDLGQEAGAVGQRPAVAVRAPVVPRREEVLEGAERVTGVDVDDVVPGLECTSDGRPVPRTEVGDVVERHAPCLDGPGPGEGLRRRPDRRDA
jgi:hypothetical protein